MDKEARIDPPIHTEYFLSGGAIILIFMVGGARAPISFCIRSAIPGRNNILVHHKEMAFQSQITFQSSNLFCLVASNIQKVYTIHSLLRQQHLTKRKSVYQINAVQYQFGKYGLTGAKHFAKNFFKEMIFTF